MPYGNSFWDLSGGGVPRLGGGGRNYTQIAGTSKAPVYAPSYGRAHGRQSARIRLFGHSRGGLSRTGGYTGFPSILNGELKFYDCALFNNAAMPNDDAEALLHVVSATNTNSLNQIPQNASSSGRIGRKAIIKSIEGKFGFTVEPQSETPAFLQQSCRVHYFLVLDTQANGAAFSASDVWEFKPNPLPRTAGNGHMPLSMLLFRNLENIQRFKILRHITVSQDASEPFTVSSTAAGQCDTSVSVSTVKTLYMKCNIPIDFDTGAVAPAITNVRSNNLQCFAVMDGMPGGGTSNVLPQFQVWANFRLRFTDTGSSRLSTSARKRVKRSGS